MANADQCGCFRDGVEQSRPAKSHNLLPDAPSIAVLPFQNMSGDPEQDYFADGIAEEITIALSRFPRLAVAARNSSFSFKGKPQDARLIGRELGVRYMLTGAIRKKSIQGPNFDRTD